jgi:hypothetical protein
MRLANVKLFHFIYDRVNSKPATSTIYLLKKGVDKFFERFSTAWMVFKYMKLAELIAWLTPNMVCVVGDPRWDLDPCSMSSSPRKLSIDQKGN